MLRAERPLGADVFVEPRVVDDFEIRTGKPAVKFVAADAAPRGVVIGAAAVEARARDIEESREILRIHGPLSS